MIAGIILAAGESRRMGRDKALLAYRGRTFLETIIQTLRAAGIENIAVVLGHHAEEIQKATGLAGARVVFNRDYQQGQTSSLQAGIRAVAAMSSSPLFEMGSGGEDTATTAGVGAAAPEAIVLALVDHPAVAPATVKRLLEAFRESQAPVVIPTHQGQRGHPVVISRALFAELLALGPGQGANTVIRKYRDMTRFVEVDDPGVLLDVDDEETYQRMP
jgi:molybdenum cofactor cytidylyltransferase